MIPAVLLFFWPLSADIWVLPKLAMAAVLVAIAGQLQGFCRQKMLTWPFVSMLAALSLSAIFSGDPLVNLFGRHSAHYMGISPLLVCFLAYQLPELPLIEEQMQLSGGLMASYALLQLAWAPLGYEAANAGHRAIGTIGAPWGLGCALAMCLPFTFKRPWLAVLVCAGLWASGSRGPMLAAVVSAAIYAYLYSDLNRNLVWLGLVPVSLYSLGHTASDHIRLMTWAMSLKVWWAHPWFGCGPESYVHAWRAFRSPEWIKEVGALTYQDHAHNDVLQVLAGCGIVGLAAYGNLLWHTWRRLRAEALLTDPQIATVASLAAVFICAKFNAVPFPVLFTLALLLGSIEHGEGQAPRLTKPAAWAIAAVFCVALAADIVYRKGRKEYNTAMIRQAISMNPAEITYSIAEVEFLTLGYEQSHDIEYLEMARQGAMEALRWHPGSVQARHALTTTLVNLANLDPHYLPLARGSAEILHSGDPMLRFVVK